jgi:rhodanese-related sulfurtransferase/glyoxylase-like metal-dependent hydrolase (beta-lactamase superfamily II)
LLDIRDPSELKSTGTIDHPLAYNLSRGWLETRISNILLNKDTPVVVYCGKNIRSPYAAKTLMEMGYTNVKNFDEGFFAWEKSGEKVWYYDKYKGSPLYEAPEEIIDGVWTAIGAPQAGNKENYGHNNNLTYIIGEDGVVVFNAGGSYTLASALHEEIKKVTNLPIKFVIYENAQGHAVLGSSYWREQGALIIAHDNFREKVEGKKKQRTIERHQRILGDKFFKSDFLEPDIYFAEEYTVPLKGRQIILKYMGEAHGQEDIILWMPAESLLITGDTGFNERMLPVLDETNIPSWLEVLAKIESLDAEYIIPGHGHATDMDTIKKFTNEYITFLYETIEHLIDEDGSLSDIYKADTTKFRNFGMYQQLNNQNLARLFKKMEFE